MSSSPIRRRFPARGMVVRSEPEMMADDGSGGQDYSGDESVDVNGLLAVLRRHIVLVGAVAFAVTAATALLIFAQRPQYEASALIRIKDVRGALTAGIGDPALQGMMMGRFSDPLLSEMEILKTRAIGETVVDMEGLRLRSEDLPMADFRDVVIDSAAPPDTFEVVFEAERMVAVTRAGRFAAPYGTPLQIPGVRFTLEAAPGVARTRFLVIPREEAIAGFLERLHVSPREMTNVVDVTFTSGNPEIAARVVNSTVLRFQALNQELAQQQSRLRREFIEEQLAGTDSLLAQVQLDLSAFRRREQVYSSSQRFASEQTTLMGLDVRREEMEAERRMFDGLLARARRPAEGRASDGLRALVSAPGMAINPVITNVYARLVQIEGGLDSLTTGRFASAQSNPDVQRLNMLAAAARADILGAAESHVEMLRARVSALDELKARTGRELEQLPDAEAEEVRLALQMETVKKIGEQLRTEYQKARVTEVVEAGQVEILAPAAVPTLPLPARRGLKLMVGLMVGLLLGGGAAFLREHMDTAISRKEDLERILQLPNLAVLPQIANAPQKGGRVRLPGRSGAKKDVGFDERERLAASLAPGSSSAEAYRVLRTNLIFSQAVDSLKTLVVTSSTPGEGKTTTAANLAVAFSQQGRRVVLVDADLRRGRLHTLFGEVREPGLTQFVLGYSSLEEVTRRTAVDGLHLVPTGALPPNPAELLGGDRMREVIRTLSAAYDMVIVDTPPLLAAADAAVLGAGVDGVLMVVRAGFTDRRQALQAVQQLDSVGARVIGATLNDVDSLLSRNPGYYGYYSYGYAHAAAE